MPKRLPKAPEAGGSLRPLAAAIAQMGNFVDSLRERTRLLEAVVENFPGGIALFDTNMQMVVCNDRLKKLLDYPDSLFAGGLPTIDELFRFNAQRGEYGPGDWREQVARRMALLKDRKAHVYERVRPNGTVLEIRGMPIDGGGFVTTYFDVTEQHKTQELVAHMAHYDALTDLPNRTLFADRVQKSVALAKRGALMAVQYLDLDNFKPVNDNFGHKVGDELLISVARRLSGTIREHDTVARLGGDEFAILQTGIHERSDAVVLARRVLHQLVKPFRIDGNDIEIGVSIGIAFAPIDALTYDDLLAKADAALYRSKTDGRGRYSFFASTKPDLPQSDLA